MSWVTWKAKRLVRRIEKNEVFIQKCKNYTSKAKKWIRKDTTKLNKVLKHMSPEDYLLFSTRYLKND